MKKPNSGDRLLFWIVIWKIKSGKTFDPPIHMPSSKVTSFFVSKPVFIQWKFRPWVSNRLFDLQMAGVPHIHTYIYILFIYYQIVKTTRSTQKKSTGTKLLSTMFGI